MVPGGETINVQVNLGLLGHSYVTGLDKVLGDLHAIGKRRFRLRGRCRPGWSLETEGLSGGLPAQICAGDLAISSEAG